MRTRPPNPNPQTLKRRFYPIRDSRETTDRTTARSRDDTRCTDPPLVSFLFPSESSSLEQLLEASELVSQIEETFGVDASAPAGGVVMAAGPGGGEEAAAEKTEFDLVITDVDSSKRIAIIKVVRSLTSLGLKEAKDAVTNLPFTILEGKTKAECEEATKTLEEGGAKCEMK